MLVQTNFQHFRHTFSTTNKILGEHYYSRVLFSKLMLSTYRPLIYLLYHLSSPGEENSFCDFVLTLSKCM